MPNFVSNFHRRELKTLSTALVGRGSQPLQGSVLFTVNDWWYAENVVFVLLEEIMFSSAFICSLVSRIMQKLLRRFSQNSVKRWHMGQEKNVKFQW